MNPYEAIQHVKLEPPRHPLEITIRMQLGSRDIYLISFIPVIPVVSYEEIEKLTDAISRFVEYCCPLPPTPTDEEEEDL